MLRIHNAQGEHVASCKYFVDAAAIVALQGDGATVQVRRQVLWREGAEDFPAGESYDAAADIMAARQVCAPAVVPQ